MDKMAKALAKYLAPLMENHHTIKNTLDFADKLNEQMIEEDEIVVSYDVTSLFTLMSRTIKRTPFKWEKGRGDKCCPGPDSCLPHVRG